MFENITKKLFTLLILMIALIFIACNAEEEEDKVTTELEGTWTQSCKQEGQDYRTGSMPSGNTWSLAYTSYSDSTCATKIVSVTLSTSFTIGNEVSGLTGTKEIDMTFTAAQLTIHDDTEVASNNADGFYGYMDWVKDTPKDIFGKKYDGTDDPDFGNPRYNIFRIDGSNLYFGDSDMCSSDCYTSAANRPTALDPDSVFIKQ